MNEAELIKKTHDIANNLFRSILIEMKDDIGVVESRNTSINFHGSILQLLTENIFRFYNKTYEDLPENKIKDVEIEAAIHNYTIAIMLSNYCDEKIVEIQKKHPDIKPVGHFEKRNI